MTNEEAKKLPHGLYIIKWDSGGYSLASVGYDREGNWWFAPCNWTSGSTPDCWEWVEEARMLHKNPTSYDVDVFERLWSSATQVMEKQACDA